MKVKTNELPVSPRVDLGRETNMDSHSFDVKLHDGRVFKNLEVSDGRCIARRSGNRNHRGELPFTAADIKKVRPHSIWPFWW